MASDEQERLLKKRGRLRRVPPELEDAWLQGVRSAACALTETVNRVLDNPEQLYLSPMKSGKDGEQSFCVSPKADVSELQRLTGVVKDLSGIMRSLYDVPTFSERESAEAQDRKLRLEEAKNAGERSAGQNHLVFLPEEAFGTPEPGGEAPE